MSPEKIALVQSTWASVLPIADQAADLFYERLFELDGSIKTLFPDDMTEQKKKLMQTLAVCVNGLNALGEIVPAVQALGRRHADYNVKPEHYKTVGAALLWTLEKGLGDKWSADAELAWTEVYGVLSATMKDAAESPA